ncbi:MAG: serine hydroxymethyltransferase [Candidatus Limivicinus sp.]
MDCLRSFDPEMADLACAEYQRQLSTLNLIVSENYASPYALALEGSILANKNAGGYPDSRGVGGCQVVNAIENLAMERIKQLFGCDHVNLQAMSATIANLAVLQALLQPGDTILALGTELGGHMSHGAAENLSGMTYQVVTYGFDPATEQIDLPQVEALAKAHRPKLIICGSGAYPRKTPYREFGAIAKSVGAYLLADIAHPAGLIAAGLLESPVPYADVVTTTTHKTWRGPRGCGVILCRKELAGAIDRAVSPGIQGSPKMDMIAARAVLAKEAMTPVFRAYQRQTLVNAQALADELSKEGFRLVSGGTDTHLILVDVRSHIASGKEADRVLSSAGLVVNKEPLPFDPLPPDLTSGIRIGTPALTTRGLKEPQFRQIARWLSQALKSAYDPAGLAQIRRETEALAKQYPLFAEEWLPRETRETSVRNP